MFASRVVLSRESGVSGRVTIAASVYELGMALGVSAVASIGVPAPCGRPRTGSVAHRRRPRQSSSGCPCFTRGCSRPLSGALLRKLGRQPLEVFLTGRQVLLFGPDLRAGLRRARARRVGLGARPGRAGAPAARRMSRPRFLLSFLVSMLAFVFPSGLGVREGILALALARDLPGGVAIGLAAAVRLVMTLVEIAFAVVVVVVERRHRRRSG